MTLKHITDMLNKSEYQCKVLCKTGRLSRKKKWELLCPWVELSEIPSGFHAERRKWDSPRDSRGMKYSPSRNFKTTSKNNSHKLFAQKYTLLNLALSIFLAID